VGESKEMYYGRNGNEATTLYCNQCDQWFEMDTSQAQRHAKEVACENCGSTVHVPQLGTLSRMWQRVMARLNSA
jgi:uncharacterized paraquat-inducible protein A